jgi:hypothetical protein
MNTKFLLGLGLGIGAFLFIKNAQAKEAQRIALEKTLGPVDVPIYRKKYIPGSIEIPSIDEIIGYGGKVDMMTIPITRGAETWHEFFK